LTPQVLEQIAQVEAEIDRIEGQHAGRPAAQSPNDPGEDTMCWPTPKTTDNINTKRVGRLGLSDTEEDALVSFMQTLTDGFMSRDRQ
jgi:hypothetical protein